MLKKIYNGYCNLVIKCQEADFIALLAIRLYLLPVIWEGAHSKVTGFSHLVKWFGDPIADGGLNMPFSFLLALLATGTEVVGFICIALGLFTRLISIPMVIVMSIASIMVHWSHGWLAIASKEMEATVRLDNFLIWLATNFPGRYNYITELGDPVILNNGMEFSVSYFIMLLVLLFWGGGRYLSTDYWLSRYIKNR